MYMEAWFIMMLIVCITVGFVFWKAVSTYAKDDAFYLLSTDDKKWKRIVELYYKDNILTVTTFDRNIRQFYHPINDPGCHGQWKRYPTKTLIKDIELIESLDKMYQLVLMDQKRQGGGWVKDFSLKH